MIKHLMTMTGLGLVVMVASGRGEDDLRLRRYGEMSVAYSPDGKWIASGGADSKVRIRDGTDGVVLATLSGHGEQVNTVAVSPDGRTIASGSDDATIRLWDAERRAERRVLIAPGGPVKSLAFAPDGQRIASGSVGGYIRLWDVATGHQTAIWSADARWTDQVAYSADGGAIASVGDDRVVKLWDAQTQKLRQEFPQAGHGSIALAYSPDGAFFAVSADREVSVRDAKTNAEKFHVLSHPISVGVIAFSRDGDQLVASGLGGTNVLFTRTNPVKSRLIPGAIGKWCVSLTVAPDRSRVAQGYRSFAETDRPSFQIARLR